MAKLDEQGKKKGDQKTISVSVSFQDLGGQKAPVSRGLTGVVVQDPPPPPGGSPGYAPTNISSGAPGSPAAFVNTPATLLGSCPRAAFAVNLYTWARATDGYSRQSQYDGSATIAFALTHA